MVTLETQDFFQFRKILATEIQLNISNITWWNKVKSFIYIVLAVQGSLDNIYAECRTTHDTNI